MKLLIAGCEYAGTHDPGTRHRRLDGAGHGQPHEADTRPLRSRTPWATRPTYPRREEQQFLALSPWLKDNVQRHNLYYHAPRQGSSGRARTRWSSACT